MMNEKDFAVFILTHGRAEKVYTYDSLLKSGYTGKVFIVIDNEDKQQAQYKEIFKEKVIVFDKKAVSLTFDNGDNFNDRRAIIYARNACFDIAKNLGVKYFLQLDDDYSIFCYSFDDDFNFLSAHNKTRICNIDRVFDAILSFYKSTNIKSIAFGQGGDFIGGCNRNWNKKQSRKCMNTFFCSTERPIGFIGRINEDVNTYTKKGSVGDLFFTTFLLRINQKQTQSNSGGMTELYLNSGTYIKSFYSVMYQPSSVKIALMGEKNKRLHHRINWNFTIPKILSESLKKK